MVPASVFQPEFCPARQGERQTQPTHGQHSEGALFESSEGASLSGPVLRDTARLSQRYPPIARYGVFDVSTWPIGCHTPSPFSECFAPLRACKVEVRYPPPSKGYLSDTCAIPYENKANGCDTPCCDTISKGCCAIWGVSRTGPPRSREGAKIPR